MKSTFLAPQTGKIIEAISRLECTKPFVLVGVGLWGIMGTGQMIQV